MRIMPKVMFGVHPVGLDGLSPDNNDKIVVLHHFLGSWKAWGSWRRKQFTLYQALRSFFAYFAREPQR